MSHVEVVIMAAGKGTRMKTEQPKALVEVKGKSLLKRVLESVRAFSAKPYVIVGYKGDEILTVFGESIRPIWQKKQKGTGHAVMMAKDMLEKTKAKHVLVLSADQPLLTPESLESLIGAREQSGAAFSLATVIPEHHNDHFAGFKNMGRIVRNPKGTIEAIIEYKNATDAIRQLKEVNITTYCFDPKWLLEHLSYIERNELSGEYYLTDLVSIASKKGHTVIPVVFPTHEGLGANTPEEITLIERL